MFTVWFTGLPASGKSTIAKRVEEALRRRGLDVENLDADEVRRNLHPKLGFSKEERGENNRRIAYLAKLLNKHDVVVIVAAVSPFEEHRRMARRIVEEAGRFFLVWVNCPVEVCKARDPKGLYERAERGEIPDFTGVSHPYEPPQRYELRLDTAKDDPRTCTEQVLAGLERAGLLQPAEAGTGREREGVALTPEEEEAIRERLRQLGYLD